MNITITLDVGGTGIKTGVFDSDTKAQIGDIFERPSRSMESRDVILDNFIGIISHAMSLTGGNVTDIRMAFPNPFDYDTGTPYIKGQNKYDSIYGVCLPDVINSALGIRPRYAFLNDIKAFALGEMSTRPEIKAKRVFYLCLGTGCGSAFSIDGEVQYDVCNGKYKKGEIWDQPYRDGILDDYLSVRGLGKIALDTMGVAYSGKQLSDMIKANNTTALDVYRSYGHDVYMGVYPILDDFKADVIIIGGNIGKSYCYFGNELDTYLKSHSIEVYFTSNTSLSAMHGLLSI